MKTAVDTCGRFAARRTIFIISPLIIFCAFVLTSVDGKELETYPIWSKIELEFSGPTSLGMGDPNPFQIGMEVRFSGPSDQEFNVPAFYDGDGSGGMDGKVWKVRFSPDEAGTWTYQTTSESESLNGLSGNFQVSSNPGCQSNLSNGLPNFSCTGRLEYVGEHYLKFANGDYWLKGGVNEPEDFLVPGVNGGFSSKLAAIDYLTDRGINSIYLMLDNIDGDRKNIWPWVGETQSEAKLNHERFDVAKLAQWEATFEMIQQQGLVLHIVFEDDSAWTGFNREMYYREIVARFGHFNGIYWNIAEEYNEVYSANQIKNFAQLLTSIDPYNHPITVHQQGGLINWEPFLADARFDLTSFQTESEPQNSSTVNWFENVEDSGRVIPVAFDESTRLLNSSERDKFRHITWSVYTGGANYEVYTRLGSTGYLEYGQILADLGRAREFLSGLAYWVMRPENQLIDSGEGYVFGAEGETYLVYLPQGGTAVLDLSGDENIFDADWFNPRNGSIIETSPIIGGDLIEIVAPDDQDWVLLLQVDIATPPQIFSTPDLETMVGQAYSYQAGASGDPPIIFRLLSFPPGMLIDPGTGHIEWSPLFSGNFQVVLQAENRAGTDEQEFMITVLPVPVEEEELQVFPLIYH